MKIPEDRVSSMGMWRLGKEFIAGAYKVHPFPQNEMYQLPSISFVANYLLAHGIELYLKSYMLAKGYTANDLIRDYGHDLEKIMKAAEDNGIGKFVELTECDRHTISSIGHIYKNKGLEYFVRGSLYLPPYHKLTDFAQRLERGLSPVVHKDMR